MYDMDAEYADVRPLDEVIDYITEREPVVTEASG